MHVDAGGGASGEGVILCVSQRKIAVVQQGTAAGCVLCAVHGMDGLSGTGSPQANGPEWSAGSSACMLHRRQTVIKSRNQ